ncbi:macro domain protein [Firmicutes bacterium CAG:449]|nr:macro domain protein [Firmicutes bacterium CAG:449]
MKLKIIKGSVVFADCDAIVNAANDRLQGGAGVCGAIFQNAGWKDLQAECDAIGGCRTGHAVMTNGYKLKAKLLFMQ